MPDIPFTVFSGIGVLICIPPAYFNWKIPCRPWATLILIFWVFILNLLFFMDSIIWSSTDLNTWWDGKIYCDIDARLKDMFEIGVGGAAIGICRFLADATDPNPSRTDLRQGRFKRNMIDFFIGIILPMILQGLKFLVEVARYRIIGVNGCQAVVAHAWPSLLVYHLWVPGLVLVATGYACRFLYNWWVIRRRLADIWALQLGNGISRAEFRRLIVTSLLVLVVYLPLSIIGLYEIVKDPLDPFVWSEVHGPFWHVIVFLEQDKAIWSTWIAVALALESFLLLGMTRNARRFGEQCVEWLYDHAPKKLQAKLGWMRKVSERCKDRRDAELAVKMGTTHSLAEMYVSACDHANSRKPKQRKAAKNWFDSDDEIGGDNDSIPMSETTLEDGDEEKAIGQLKQRELDDRLGASAVKTEISAGSGSGAPPSWTRGVQVTKQVLIQSSLREP